MIMTTPIETNPHFASPSRSVSQPTQYGPAKPARFPIAFTVAIPPAAAAPVKNAVGNRQKPGNEAMIVTAHTNSPAYPTQGEAVAKAVTASDSPPMVMAIDAPTHVRRLLDALTAFPAYAIAPDWGISAWNPAYEALYPNVAKVSAEERNLLWLVFTDPYVRELLPDWETDSRHFLAQFRAEAGPRLGDPSVSRLVGRLLDSSESFRTWWHTHDIEPFTSRERWFNHPQVGALRLEHHRLAPSDCPDLHVVIYIPVDLDTTQRLQVLTARS